MSIVPNSVVPSAEGSAIDLAAFIEAMIGEGADAVELGPTDALLCVAALHALVGRTSLFSRSKGRLDQTVRQ